MPRVGLTPSKIVDICLEVASEGGEVTLGTVAARAGVKPPSLYKHVASAADLDSLVAERVLADFARRIRKAFDGLRGTDAVAAAMHAYRRFARTQPSLYALMPVQPGNDPRLEPIGKALMDDIAHAIGFEDAHSVEALDALRLVRAAADGFVRLELAGGFGQPADVNASYERLVEVISRAAAAVGPEGYRAPARNSS